MTRRLHQNASAWVTTAATQPQGVVGPVVLIDRPVDVYVEAGAELPDNLAPGQLERLDALGVLEPE